MNHFHVSHFATFAKARAIAGALNSRKDGHEYIVVVPREKPGYDVLAFPHMAIPEPTEPYKAPLVSWVGVGA